MRALITGATGFIGKRLARYLLNCGAGIIALGRRPAGIEGVEDLVLSDLAPQLIGNALYGRRFDMLIHLAAAGVHPHDRDVQRLIAINAEFPGRLISAAAQCGCRAAVIVGSSSEYLGNVAPGSLLSEQAPLEMFKLYGASKVAGGILGLALAKHYDMPTAVLRLFNTYGPGEAPHRLLPSLFESLRIGKRTSLSLGTQIRDFVYVDDACEGLWHSALALIEGRLPSGAYNLCSSQGHSVAEFARLTAQAMGVSEDLLGFGDLQMRPDEIPFLVGDNTALFNAIGWSPLTPLPKGIALSVAALIHELEQKS